MRRRVLGMKEKVCISCLRKFIGRIDEGGRFCSTACKEKGPKKEIVLLPAFPMTKKKKVRKLVRKNRRREAIRLLQKENAELKKVLKKNPVQVMPSASKLGFYESDAWRQLRYKVIKANGRKCQACGTVNKQIHVDHIKPRSKFPELELTFSNLQVLCIDCNLGKSNLDDTDWRGKGIG